MMRPLRIYLSGSIKKGAGDSRASDHFWTKEDEEFIRTNAGRPVELLNPAKADIRRQDFAINFGCDLHLVSISDVVLVDARREKGIGVGAEMMYAVQHGIPIITWSPPETHYRRSKIADLFGEDLHDWTHPFVFGLSDHVVDNLNEAMTIIRSGAIDASQPRLERVDALIQRYRASISDLTGKTDKRFVDIGSGVFQDLLGGGGEQEMIAGSTRYRFMDVLYLPTPTDQIPLDALLSVNRWRERRIEERSLPHWSRMRRVVACALKTLMPDGVRVLEIGCGKFPLADDVSCTFWSGLETDPEAVAFLRNRGLRIAAAAAEVSLEDLQVGAAVALFSMQFAIQEEEIGLFDRLPSDSIVVFNLPTRDRLLVDRRLQRLHSLGFHSRHINLRETGTRDIIVAAGRQNVQERLLLVSQALLSQATAEWPATRLFLES